MPHVPTISATELPAKSPPIQGRPVVESITPLVTDVGGRVDWLPKSELIAYDKLSRSGYFDVWTMRADGSAQKCLTCANKEVPQRHKGNPAWHPSGKYILLQALDDSITGPLENTEAYRIYTNPGAGFGSTLWLITSDGRQAWQMTSSSDGLGILHPHFSRTGDQVVWARMTSTDLLPLGTWDIMIADFVIEGGTPALRHPRSLVPGDFQWYETHEFTWDDQGLLFTAMPRRGNANDFDLYRLDLASGAVMPLTSSAVKAWDEHGHLFPDGQHIVWISSMGAIENVPLNQLNVKTDLWLMDVNGDNQVKLTGFNDPSSPHYRQARVIASDISLSSDGTRLVAYLQVDSTASRPGEIDLIQISWTQ